MEGGRGRMDEREREGDGEKGKKGGGERVRRRVKGRSECKETEGIEER